MSKTLRGTVAAVAAGAMYDVLGAELGEERAREAGREIRALVKERYDALIQPRVENIARGHEEPLRLVRGALEQAVESEMRLADLVIELERKLEATGDEMDRLRRERSDLLEQLAEATGCSLTELNNLTIESVPAR